MLSTATAFVLSLALSATALPIAPLSKRVAQVIAESTQPWQTACQAAGGGAKCNEISVTAFSTLLAAPGPCAQQDAADAMIDLAKSLPGDTSEMISLAQIFRQQPRNAPDSLAVLYCQNVARNPELNGLFQCQFEGVKQDTFTGNLAVGAPGTIPLGLDAPLSPPGSCPANPAGPVPDGVQLHTLTRDPGVPGAAPPAEGGEEPSETEPAASETPSATESAPTEAASETASVTESVTETPSATEAPSETASATESANTATGTDGTVTVTQTVTVTAGAAECTVTDDGKNNNKGNGGAKGRKGPQRNRNKAGQRGRGGNRGGANGGGNDDNEASASATDSAAQETSTDSAAAAPEPTEPAPARQRRPNAAGGHH